MKIFSLLSPTWLLADYLKGQEKDRTVVIKDLNTLYLGIAITSVFVVLIYQGLLAPAGAYSLSAAVPIYWKIAWSYYLLSRCNEVFYAFLCDAFDKISEDRRASSRLTPKDRIQLALRSYIELIINFALLYALMPPTNTYWNNAKPPESITTALYFSGVTITTVGYGDISPDHWWPQFLVIYEVFCGVILLVVCFTIYSGMSGRKETTESKVAE